MKKKTINLALAVFLSMNLAAQTATTTGDAFRIDQKMQTLTFRLPESAQVNDAIYFTYNNGVVIKKVEINDDILRSGRYTFGWNTIPPGNYLISVVSNSMIKYSFEFNNKGPVTTHTIKDGKLLRTLSSESEALSFHPATGEFVVNTSIAFSEGNKIEVYDEVQHTLVATAEVTPGMIAAKQYAVKAVDLHGGTFSVTIDGVKFGNVQYAP